MHFPALSNDPSLIRAVAEFSNSFLLVHATVPMLPWPGDPDSEASIVQIKDHNYGLIEVKCGGAGERATKLFCLFHKDQVMESCLLMAASPRQLALDHLTSWRKH